MTAVPGPVGTESGLDRASYAAGRALYEASGLPTSWVALGLGQKTWIDLGRRALDAARAAVPAPVGEGDGLSPCPGCESDAPPQCTGCGAVRDDVPVRAAGWRRQ